MARQPPTGPPQQLSDYHGGDVPTGPWQAITWRHARPADVARRAEELQRALAPGGQLVLMAPKAARRCAKLLRPYFEGGVPAPGQRYAQVVAVRENGTWIVRAFRRGPGLEASHFDELAGGYDLEIPGHLRDHYLNKKVDRIARHARPGTVVLEVGSGTGHYARALAERLGSPVMCVDHSRPLLAAAVAGGGLDGAAGDAQALPVMDGAVDTAYCINMLHHLKQGEQKAALAELARVVRPGGHVLVFEINIRNPVYRFYMRKIFPRTRRIDRGDEEFLDARRLPLPPQLRVLSTEHYTFIPDFAPRRGLGLLRRIEGWMESSWLAPWAIHYTVTLERVSVAAGRRIAPHT